ncbi:Methyltransferase-like protein 24-like 6 [Homarus americanus]|uniref:Methyltransferase-like protein 24-like 6 n=2 Tax=Homarus americanus TaxID=6706 RepID=A0A8J5MSF7_HOMAM|nr:Methyltransferase-like protein 24-like 6 [Homarus americanus]
MCFTPALESIEEFFTYIRTPTAHCRTSARLGGVKTRQGVYNLKWVCLDSKYHIKRDSCLVFSFGMDSNGEFENDIMRLVGCKVYVFDPSITQDTHTINIHVLDVGVADYTGTMLIGWRFYPVDRYENLLLSLALENSVVDYLKIDIDGSELRFLRDIFTTTPYLPKKIKQLGMVIHPGKYSGESIRALDMFQDLWKYFKLLECYGFSLIFSNLNDVPSEQYTWEGQRQSRSYELVWVHNRYY